MFRKISSGIVIAAVLAFTAVGCSILGGSSGTVSLASAQAEAQAILTGLDQAATVYEASPQADPAVVKQMQADIAAATTAVDAFTAVNAGPTAPEIAQAATQAIEVAIAVAPIDPATKAAVDLGLSVLDAFIGGISPPAGVPAAAPTSVTAAIFGARETVQPPVSIPAPQYVPGR